MGTGGRPGPIAGVAQRNLHHVGLPGNHCGGGVVADILDPVGRAIRSLTLQNLQARTAPLPDVPYHPVLTVVDHTPQMLCRWIVDSGIDAEIPVIVLAHRGLVISAEQEPGHHVIKTAFFAQRLDIAKGIPGADLRAGYVCEVTPMTQRLGLLL